MHNDVIGKCFRLGCRHGTEIRDMKAQIATLTAQLAEARASERAAVVGWLRLKTWKHYGTERDMLASFATAIEAGEHLTCET